MKPHEINGQSMTDDDLKKMAPIDASPTVEVLLATYNGERFLREQIDSILSQDYENLQVSARDDGSSDGTTTILNEYAKRFPDRFQIVQSGLPTGSAKENFLQLMKTSTANYICFSDQDDVWLPNKVSRTMHAMIALEARRGSDIPLLVFTDLRVVDNKLKTLHGSFWKQAGIKPSSISSLAAILGHNVVTGCTTLINRRLLDMALCMPPEASMHDAWIALLTSAFGAAEIVWEKTVLYRQHDQNVVGIDAQSKSPRELVERFLQRNPRVLQWQRNESMAKALLRIYGEKLSPENRRTLEAYLRCGESENRIARVATMIRYRFFRPGFLRNATTFIDLWRGKMACPDSKKN